MSESESKRALTARGRKGPEWLLRLLPGYTPDSLEYTEDEDSDE